MYHYITLGPWKIYMTGLGIVAFLGVFFWMLRHYCRIYRLSFQDFFQKSPTYIILTYLMSTYLYYLIENFTVFPVNREQILLYLTPYGYNFHYIGLLLGILVSGRQFLRTVPEYDRDRWIDALFQSILYGLIPLGIFLVLGDTFIGVQTNGSLYVSAIRPDSNVAKYDRVFPLGFAISLVGILGAGIGKLIESKWKRGFGYYGLGIVLILIGIILIWQQAPKRLVYELWGTTIGIKQYLSRGAGVVLIMKGFTRKQPIR